MGQVSVTKRNEMAGLGFRKLAATCMRFRDICIHPMPECIWKRKLCVLVQRKDRYVGRAFWGKLVDQLWEGRGDEASKRRRLFNEAYGNDNRTLSLVRLAVWWLYL